LHWTDFIKTRPCGIWISSKMRENETLIFDGAD
jgi:hypothetical protein